MLWNDKRIIEAHRKLAEAFGVPFNPPGSVNFSEFDPEMLGDLTFSSVSNPNDKTLDKCPSVTISQFSNSIASRTRLQILKHDPSFDQ